MKEFFLNLKAKRHELGISLQEIHEKSRLPLQHLEAIESGQLEDLPSGYERLYLKRYAKEVGLDVEEVLRDFDLLSGRLTPKDPEATPEQSHQQHDLPVQETQTDLPAQHFKKKMPKRPQKYLDTLDLGQAQKLFWLSLTVLIIVIAGYFTYQQYVDKRTNQQIEIKEITISELIEDFQARDSTLTPPMPDNTVLRSQDAQLVVRLSALERTWIREIRDIQDTTEYILPTGLRRYIEAVEQVKFVLGRADGIEIWLNGKKLERLGNANQVVWSLVLTKDGIKEKRLKQIENQPTVTPEKNFDTDSLTKLDSVNTNSDSTISQPKKTDSTQQASSAIPDSSR